MDEASEKAVWVVMQRKHIVNEPAEDEAASDPMDIWLKQQLGGLHTEMLGQELPGELGALAAALEARLRAAVAKPRSEPDSGAGSESADD